MRSFAYGALLGGVSVALHGCGSSGEVNKNQSNCINERVNLVTQSVQGFSVGNASIKLDVTGIEDLPAAVKLALAEPILVKARGDYNLKMDVEKFNVRFDTTDTFEVSDIVTIPVKATIDGTVIFNVAKNEVVVASGTTIDVFGMQIPIKSYCNISSVAGLPSLKNMTEMFKIVNDALQDTVQCIGSDGSYDNWKFSPAAIPALFPFTLGMDLLLDKNYLWKQVLLNVSGHMPHPVSLPAMPKPMGNITVQSITADGGLSFKANSMSPNGPTAADLDYRELTHTCASTPVGGITDIVQQLLSHRMEAQAMVAMIAKAGQRSFEFVTV